jgi:hypothetical protein
MTSAMSAYWPTGWPSWSEANCSARNHDWKFAVKPEELCTEIVVPVLKK